MQSVKVKGRHFLKHNVMIYLLEHHPKGEFTNTETEFLGNTNPSVQVRDVEEAPHLKVITLLSCQ